MRCDDCMEWLVVCPCCKLSFCPGCGITEDELEEKQLEEESEDD